MYKKDQLSTKNTWLITGAAGFIGSHLLEFLLVNRQNVIGIDNFITGHRRNLESVRLRVGEKAWSNFDFREGDINDYGLCKSVSCGVDYVLHQAALGSVPRSLDDPLTTNKINIDGFLNVLHAAKENKVKRFVYAASSSTYGDSQEIPKVEDNTGLPLSPYAVTKFVNELYAGVYSRNFDLDCVGLRYFNVFGSRQDPNGSYAAVIPRWINKLKELEQVDIYGDGSTSRDFCFVENAVQANILAATRPLSPGAHVFNVACGQSTSLMQLFQIIVDTLSDFQIHNKTQPKFLNERAGDIKHSLADISHAKSQLNYEPVCFIEDGVRLTVKSFIENE